MTPLLAAILGYLVLQFGIGIWAGRRVRDENDYLIAGRRLGYPLATFSIFATWFGAETCIGAAGEIYREGVGRTTAEPFGYGLCLVLMGLLFAVPLWRRGLTTLADLFRTRFSTGVERLAAVILIPGSILWAAAQVRAFGQVLSSASTLDVETAVTLAAVFVVLYTFVGGMLADAMTDLVQGIVLVVGLVVVGVAAVIALGGPAGAVRAVTVSPALSGAAGGEPATWLATLEAWAIPICGSVLATELVGRVIAARSANVARGSSIAAGGLYLGVGLIPVFIGLAGFALVPELAEAEQLLPTVARNLLPPGLYLLFAGALLSAMLSTVDSTLLVAAGLASRNIVTPYLSEPGARARIRIARGSVVVFGTIAWTLAVRAEGVYALVEQASALGSAGTLVIVSAGLFTGVGGALAATMALLGGLGAYVGGLLVSLPYPFLGSLAFAAAGYLCGAGLELMRPAGPPASPTSTP